jgi:hypothetical protein
MTPTWMAPARAAIDDLPPTLPGLVGAVRTADEACHLLARSIGARSISTGPGAAALMCTTAVACLEPDDPTEASSANATRTARAVTLPPPADPSNPSHARELEGLLRDCIELAVAVLDNDEIDLDLAQVTDIGTAVSLLDRARAHLLGLAQ